MKKFVTPFYPTHESEKFFHPSAIAMDVEDLIARLEKMKVHICRECNVSDEDELTRHERNRTLDEVIEMVKKQ